MGRPLALSVLVTLLASCSAFDMPSETEKGYAALAKGDYPAAAHWFTIAGAAKPDDLTLMLDLAASDQKLGQFDAARILYLKVAALGQHATPDPAAVSDPR